MSFSLELVYEFVLAPLVWLIFQVGRFFGGEKWKLFVDEKNRRRFYRGDRELGEDEIRALAAKRPIWIHAASGEIEYARPVLRELHRQFPEVPLLVTYTSPSARRILRKLPEPAAWGPVPWEFRGQWARFFERWNPAVALFARTDVWPLAARESARRKIPAALFSATFAANSSRLSFPVRSLTLRILSRLQRISVVSGADGAVLGEAGFQGPVEIDGDTRFDQVFHRLEHPQPVKESLRPDEPILVAGSTWPEDDEILLELLGPQGAGVKILWAPHEVNETRLSELGSRISARGARSGRYSVRADWKDIDVLILDELGVLAELYRWGRVAFVGGSFRRQVHSVMEPLAAGCPVLVGPHHLNNREALEFQSVRVQGEALVTAVSDALTLRAALERKLAWSHGAEAETVRQTLRSRAGATERIVAWVRFARR